MRKPNVLNVAIRVEVGPATPDDAKDGAKYSSCAKVKITPYGSFWARSAGTSQHSARKFAQAFVLKKVADAILAAAEDHEAVNVTNATAADVDPMPSDWLTVKVIGDRQPEETWGPEDDRRVCLLAQATGVHKSTCAHCVRARAVRERGGIRGVDHG